MTLRPFFRLRESPGWRRSARWSYIRWFMSEIFRQGVRHVDGLIVHARAPEWQPAEAGLEDAVANVGIAIHYAAPKNALMARIAPHGCEAVQPMNGCPTGRGTPGWPEVKLSNVSRPDGRPNQNSADPMACLQL